MSMGRIQGLIETLALTGSLQLKTGKATVFSITLAWTSGTIGHKVYLRDGTDGAAPARVVFILPSTSGTITKEWPQGKEFVDGLYYDEGQSGTCFTELTYK
jgi:hypothetical protein